MTDTEISIEEARQQLHALIRKDIPFNDKARDALELATQCLGTDNGHVARIDQETDYWEAIITTDTPDGQTPPGLELNLTDTYCRETIEDEKSIIFHDASNQGWTDDPAFETRELHTYLGVPLIVDNEPYGTVCFVAEEPRSEAFSDAEAWFAEHLTRLLERELEREQVEAQLTKQTNFATVLNRVLRHNFRNDISVIRGQTEVLAEQLDEEPITGTVLSKIDNLIEFTEKARDLEEIITASSTRQQTEIGALITDIVGSIEQEYSAASISVDCDDEIYLEVLQNFDRAVEELIENAVKHSGDSPVVTVAVDKLPNAVEIEISDNGPGLPENEAEVLETGAETPLTHGSGVGLWKAHWIVTGHDGTLNSLDTEDGTTLTMTIPQKSAISVQNQLTELTRSRDKYRQAFEKATDAIAIVSDDGRIMEANPATGAVFGMESEELIGRLLSEFLPDEFDFTTWQEFQESGNKANTVTVTGGDGEERVVEYSGIADIIPGQHLFISRDISERVEREQTLRETSQRLEAVVKSSPEPILSVDTDGIVRLWNDAAERVFEYTAEEAVGTPIQSLDLYSETEESEIPRQFQRTLAGDRFQNAPLQRQTKTGKTVHLNISTAPLHDETGEITGAIAVGSDVTEQKRREAELERYETVLQTITDSAWVYDADKRVVFANEALLNQLSTSHDQLIDTHLTAFEDNFVDSETFDAWETLIDDVLAGAVTSDEMDIEFDLTESRTVMNLSVAPVIEDGEPTGVVVVARDITERKERERTLTTRTEAMEKAPVGLIVTDPDKHDNPMVYANEKFREMTGYDDEAIIGHNCRFLQGDETEPEKIDTIRTAIDNGESASTVLRNYRKDGTMFWNSVSIAPVTDADGEITNWIGFQEDVTDRIEREQRLEQAETVFQNTQDAIFVIDVTDDQEFHIQRVNEVYEKLTGLSNDEIQGKTPREVVGDDIGGEIEAQYRKCVEERETISYPEEIPVDGELRHWQTKVTPIIKNERVMTLIGAMRDVTAQKQ